jgi:formylglycine-generating enzyme required for sulfatase activity
VNTRTPYSLLIVGVLSALLVWALTLPTGPAQSALVDTAPAMSSPTAEEVYVPAGPFARGCSLDFSSVKCDGDARPIHLVYVDAFYIDRTEVSNEKYAECVAAGGCRPPMAIHSNTRPDYYTNPAYRNYPVMHVDWDRAAVYCNWRGQRLPTEAEWEKAARGTDLRLFPWGDGIPDCQMANIAMLDSRSCRGDTTPVDSFPHGASPYGAINMVGNLREWVNDLYETFYYRGTPYYNPQGPEQTDKGEGLVRGGSWADHIDGASNNWARTDESGIYHMEAIGFRCARSAPVAPTPTPTPTPSPTPLPSDVAVVGPQGGMVWIARPGHLTALHVPAGSLASERQLTVTYMQPRPVGDLGGMDHFFTVGEAQFTAPAALLLGFRSSSGIVPGTAGLYRLDGGTWVTSDITVAEQSASHMLAWITQPGTYGILGETNRIYLPVAMRP